VNSNTNLSDMKDYQNDLQKRLNDFQFSNGRIRLTEVHKRMGGMSYETLRKFWAGEFVGRRTLETIDQFLQDEGY
jgi:hypothetical protein